MHRTVSWVDEVADRYTLGAELGKGRFSVVFRCFRKHDGAERAVKIIQKRRSTGAVVENEMRLLTEIKHPNIICIHEMIEMPRYMCLFTDVVAGGELFHYVANQDTYSESIAIFAVREILNALCYLHEQLIVHRDVKPENILLREPNNIENGLVLIDFGLSKRLQPGQYIQEICGTAEFASPEVISFEDTGCSTDLWSLGCVTYVLLCGVSPFVGDTVQDTYVNVTLADIQFTDDYFEDVSLDAIEFIRGLIVKNPKLRMTAKQSLDHCWLKSTDSSTIILSKTKSNNFEMSSPEIQRKNTSYGLHSVPRLRAFNQRIRIQRSLTHIDWCIGKENADADDSEGSSPLRPRILANNNIFKATEKTPLPNRSMQGLRRCSLPSLCIPRNDEIPSPVDDSTNRPLASKDIIKKDATSNELCVVSVQ